MRGHFRCARTLARLFFGFLLLLPLTVMSQAVRAQSPEVDFSYIHDQLAPYGDWVYSDRWGEVWLPNNVPDDFRPYDTNGYWADTDEYGLTWASDYEWGDIPFHFGRWVNDPDDGWLWIPGYVWSPGWVVWRSNDQYMGWMPMPPDEAFLEGTNDNLSFGFGNAGVSINFNDTNDYYGYSRWYGRDYDENRFASNWVFVGAGHVADRDFHSYVANKGTSFANIFRNTKNITNYAVVNDHVVNRSVDARQIERLSGHPVKVMKATEVMRKSDLITRANTGRQVQARMRQEIPHGSGVSNSAPKPTPAVVNTLSTHVAQHNGRQPAHLFTKSTVSQAPLAVKPTVAPVAPTNETPAEHRTQMRGQQPNATGGTNPSAAPAPTTETPAEHRAQMRGQQPNATGGTNPSAAPAPTTETPAEHRAQMRGQQPNATSGTNPSAAPAPTTETPAEHRAQMRGQQPNATGGTNPSAAPAPTTETPAEHRATRKSSKPENSAAAPEKNEATTPPK